MSDWIVSLPDRLDAFLAKDGRSISRAQAQRAIEEGRVLVNGDRVTKIAFRLQEGDTVSMEEPVDTAVSTQIDPTDLDLSVLYEDDACMVIGKPAGFSVHPGAGMAPGEFTLLHGIAHLFIERGLPFSPQAVLVHRLDKETSGCLLVAKTREAHLLLQKQFEERTVTKFYLTLVAGVPSPTSAVIDAPIGRATFERTKMSVLGINHAREARTTYRTLSVSTKKDAALLLCQLHTGRTHQIRVHLSSIGHAVLGDDTYTSQLAERIQQDYDIRSLCLHAWKLTFHSPATRKEVMVAATLPATFLQTLTRLGIAEPA